MTTIVQAHTAFRWTAVLAAVLTLEAVLPGLGAETKAGKKAPAEKPAEQPAKKPRVKVTISKETTYVTGPLRKDGYVDYVAALNERCGRGVTPENNAAMLFWKAAGPAEIPKANRERFFKMLGTPPLPEQGDYFVPLDAYVKRLQDAGKLPASQPGKEAMEAFSKQESQAMERPWSRKEFPVLADWLAANEKPLAILAEACKCPRCYEPATCEDMIAPIGDFSPALEQHREFARVLLRRAMLRLGEGTVDEAWEDLLNCHRLARLVGQRPMLIDALVAVAIDGMACSGDRVFLQHARLRAAQAVKLRNDLARLPTLVNMADTFDVGERFVLLDCMSTAARKGLVSVMESLNNGKPVETTMPLANLTDSVMIDWNVVLRTANPWYDRMAAAYRKPTQAERKAAIRKIDEEALQFAVAARDMRSLAWSALANPRRATSQQLGRVLVSVFLPAISAVADADDRAVMRFDLVKLAFALAAYRADHGAYPAKLTDLVPKYVAQVPKDIFVDADLHYRRKGDGYLLYSVGANGKDDGGRGYEDQTVDEPCDDLVVRMPGAGK